MDTLEKEEIVDELSLLCILSCVTLHVSTSSLKLTPTLIYCAPDLLLFCHPDMFNKYCLVRAGYATVLQRCCCLSARRVMDYVGFKLLQTSNTPALFFETDTQINLCNANIFNLKRHKVIYVLPFAVFFQ